MTDFGATALFVAWIVCAAYVLLETGLAIAANPKIGDGIDIVTLLLLVVLAPIFAPLALGWRIHTSRKRP